MTMTNAPHGVLANHDFNSQIEIDNKTHWVSRPDSTSAERWSNPPEIVGAEKNRVCFFLKLIDIKSTTRGFDVYTFKDEVGNLFIAFSGGMTACDTEMALECDNCYVIKATIKRHAEDTYNPGRTKQNIINRIMVLKTIGKKVDENDDQSIS